MYIWVLIPRNSTEWADAVPIVNRIKGQDKQIKVSVKKLIATNQRVVAAQRQQRGLVVVTIRGSVLFYSSAIIIL